MNDIPVVLQHDGRGNSPGNPLFACAFLERVVNDNGSSCEVISHLRLSTH